MALRNCMGCYSGSVASAGVHMSCSLNLKGGYIGDFIRDYYGVFKGILGV